MATMEGSISISSSPVPPAASSEAASSITTQVEDIIFSHFEAHQRVNDRDDVQEGRGGVSGSIVASTRAAAIRDDTLQLSLAASVSRMTLSDVDANEDKRIDEESVEEETAFRDAAVAALLRCIDSAMLRIDTAAAGGNKECWAESVASIFELAASLSCSRGDGTLACAVVNRAVEYSCVETESIRQQSTVLLGWCIQNLTSFNARGRPSATEKAPDGRNLAFLRMDPDACSDRRWRNECLDTAATGLLPRLVDKSQAVRNSSIKACSFFFQHSSEADSDEADLLVERYNSVVSGLLWNLSTDPSFANRALAAQCVPTREDTIPYLIVRVKDIKAKVREAALDSLRNKVAISELTEDQRVEILQAGLTRRCLSTHSKTVQLLCCNWMRSAKFDPILLIQNLDPVLNESVCETAAGIIIHVANSLDRASDECVDNDVLSVRKHFSEPETRSFISCVLKKLSIVRDEDDGPLDPALSLFLRMKCTVTTKSTALSMSKKMEIIGNILTDIPTLCNVLTGYLNKLIEFNHREDDDFDEDEAATFEEAHNFICLQLIHMAKTTELREEGSRRHFVTIMRNMLSRLETPDDLIEAGIKAMAAAHDTEAQFLQTISEVLADVDDDDSFGASDDQDEKAIEILRQMRVIAILSIVLENTSGRMATNPILTGFSRYLTPAVTSNNCVVRESGVSCLGKYALLSNLETVMDEFKPLLLKIAGSEEEKVEVRAQAALAMCDLALLHDNLFSSSAGDEGSGQASNSFRDMLVSMLGHSNAGIVVIAAEIAAKLLLAGRFHDPYLIAWLVVIYFDEDFASYGKDDDAEDIKEVGSPVRLQQLLSLFFPAYSIRSQEGNDAIMDSVAPTLSIVNKQMIATKNAKSTSKWPIAKMIEYICYNVDLADKQKNDTIEKAKERFDRGENASNCDTVTSLAEKTDNTVTCSTEQTENEENKKESDGKEDFTEASSTLIASIEIAIFLVKESSSTPSTYVRTLSKILGSARIDTESEDKSLLSSLKSKVSEAEYATADASALRYLAKLSRLLVDIKVCDDGDDESLDGESERNGEDDVDSDEEELIKAVKRASLNERPQTEKENNRQSTGSTGEVKDTTLEALGSSRRSHVATVN